MTPLPFAWPTWPVYWAVYVWVYLPESGLIRKTQKSGPRPVEDRGSLRVLLLSFSAAVFGGFLLAFAAPWAALPGKPLFWFVTGLLLLIAGSLLRRHCFKVLGKFFTGAVTIQSDHRVIEEGAYRWVRHPSYSAALLIVLGTTLPLGNWLSVLFAFPLALYGYNYRARVEEQALLAALGDPYARFMASRRRFIPYVY